MRQQFNGMHTRNEESTDIMTVSAVCKFRPNPPALVDRMKTWISESLALNCCTCPARSSVFVPPSRRRYLNCIIFRKSSMMSMTFVIWKNMRTCENVRSRHGKEAKLAPVLCGQLQKTLGVYERAARLSQKFEQVCHRCSRQG